MIKRLFAIGFIFACTSIAWMVLGGSIMQRTYSSDNSLRQKVQQIWGVPQSQLPPVAVATTVREVTIESDVDGKKVKRNEEVREARAISLDAGSAKVDLRLDHRQKGLLWYAAYAVDFSATYKLTARAEHTKEIEIVFPFPAQNAIYDGVRFEVKDHPWLEQPLNKDGKIIGRIAAKPGDEFTLLVAYRSQGMDNWTYRFGDGVADVKKFDLAMTTNFADIDFPEESIAPSTKQRTENGWALDWKFDHLVTGVNIGMILPQKLQPGPLAGQISFFAPISLFFFIVILLVISVIKKIEIHPVHFFFLSAAFFAFHLLLAYLADQISIHLAFITAACVSIFLVVSYLRIILGLRFALMQAGVAQFVYLVLFSYAFFFKGLTGLAITIGAVVTLFVMMQLTARVNWSEVFSAKAA